MSLPWYKRFPRDFLEGTVGMSLETKGAYGVVLDLIFLHNGELRDDARYISGQLGCSVRKWRTIRDKLLAAGKLSVNDGKISNSRAEKELKIQRKYQETQRENRRGSSKNNNLKDPACHQPEPESKPHIDTEGISTAATVALTSAREGQHDTPAPAAADDLTHRERILTLCGADPVSGLTGPNGRQIGTPQDMLEVKAWTEDLGVSEQDQLAIIEAIMQRRGSDPPARLKYFTPAMQRFAAEQNRPPLLPTDGGSNAPATREDQREAARRREEERRARIYEAAARGST